MEKKKYPEGYVEVKSICPNWVTDNFLDFMDLNLEDLKGKNITSIGGGFGIFEMDAAQNGAKVTIVDPMFMDENYVNLKLQENIDWIKDKIKRQKRGILEGVRNDVEKILRESDNENEKLECKEKLKWYDGLKIEKDEYSDRHKQLLNHLKNWKENQKKYGLILNSSSGDNIQGVDTSSQDMVVIGHILGHIYNKSSGNIRDFLEQGYKILKLDGKLWIIDYVGDIKNLEKILEKTELKKYYRVNRGSFVCCFDKKGLNKFLQEDIR